MTLQEKIVVGVHHDDDDGVATDFVIRNRTIVHKYRANEVAVLGSTPLKEVDDLLYEISTRQAAKDITTTLDQVKVHFDKGKMRGELGDKKDLYFLTTGASQIAQLVLPARYWRGTKKLTTLPGGEAVASSAWTIFAAQQNKKQHVVRLVRIKNEDKSISYAVRAVVSPTYALYSNREFVQDLMYNTTEFGSLPVLQFHLTDQIMRLDFVAISSYLSLMATFDPSVLDFEPMPIITAWNSEVGRSKIVLKAGLYNAITNGTVGHWDESTQFSWIHRAGNSGMELKTKVSQAFKELVKASVQVIDAYTDTKHILVENPEAWLKNEIARFDTLPPSITNNVIAALKSDRVTPGDRLATILDALTLVSGQEKDIFRKADIEAATGRIMKRGLEASHNNTIKNNQ